MTEGTILRTQLHQYQPQSLLLGDEVNHRLHRPRPNLRPLY